MNKQSICNSKEKIRKKILGYESLGFFLSVVTCWVTEYFDPPFSIQQVAIETLIITLLWLLTFRWTSNFLAQIKKLEGFMVICASCKQIKAGQHWVRIEEVLADKSDLVLSHSVCPDCAVKLYGNFLNSNAKDKPASVAS